MFAGLQQGETTPCIARVAWKVAMPVAQRPSRTGAPEWASRFFVPFEKCPLKRSEELSSTAITIEVGSTNVYADLGHADAAEMQRKSQLAGEIARAIKANQLTQDAAAGVPSFSVQ